MGVDIASVERKKRERKSFCTAFVFDGIALDGKWNKLDLIYVAQLQNLWHILSINPVVQVFFSLLLGLLILSYCFIIYFSLRFCNINVH